MIKDFAIQTQELTKQYANVRALDEVSLAIPHGAICALIGRNGAGKTTAIRTLLGMVHATSGSGQVLGLSIDDARASVQIRRRVAFVDPTAIYPWMTVGQVLRLVRGCYADWNRSREIAGIFALDLPLARKVSELSKGMRTKLAVLISLARDAEVLFFDEPTDGLDPVVREQVIRSLIAINAQREATLVVSSHQLGELEDVANWLCLLDRGRLVLSGEMEQVRGSHHRFDVRWDGDASPLLGAVPGVLSVTRNGMFGTMIVVGNIHGEIVAAGASIVKQQPASLKEIVLAYGAPDRGNADWVTLGMRDAVA